ncbi:hypothetical protein D3C80_2016640 [compost metagenome]
MLYVKSPVNGSTISETPMGVNEFVSGWVGPPAKTKQGWKILQQKIINSDQTNDL